LFPPARKDFLAQDILQSHFDYRWCSRILSETRFSAVVRDTNILCLSRSSTVWPSMIVYLNQQQSLVKDWYRSCRPTTSPFCSRDKHLQRLVNASMVRLYNQQWQQYYDSTMSASNSLSRQQFCCRNQESG
jgi:hypothetical protein